MALYSEKQDGDVPAVDCGEQCNSPDDLENQRDSVPQDGSHQLAQIDPELERRVVRKIDMHLMPLVMGMCRHLVQPDSTIANNLGIRLACISGSLKHWVSLFSNHYHPSSC